MASLVSSDQPFFFFQLSDYHYQAAERGNVVEALQVFRAAWRTIILVRRALAQAHQ